MKIFKRIELFNSIRDVPFCITGKNKAYCSSKSNKLKNDLNKIGIDSEVMQGWFRWSELNIPKKIKSLIEIDKQKHVFLRVYIPEKKQWVFIDPTWDSKLESVFSIAQWDGINGTVFMTKMNKISKYKKVNIFFRLFNKLKKRFNSKNNNDFYRALDNWLEEIRLKNK